MDFIKIADVPAKQTLRVVSTNGLSFINDDYSCICQLEARIQETHGEVKSVLEVHASKFPDHREINPNIYLIGSEKSGYFLAEKIVDDCPFGNMPEERYLPLAQINLI